MSQSTSPVVQTQPIGYAPILRHYFEQCQIANIIDDHVARDPRRNVLTHGEACVAMITGILYQVFALYNLTKFARETDILQVLLPGISPGEYFDDRLADTLDAVYDYGLGNLEVVLTRQMLTRFEIDSAVCHNDPPSASVSGHYSATRTDQSIRITFGDSKKHRGDLKQLVWSLSVSSDSAFPLFQQAYSGNPADVDPYLEQWQPLIDLLGRHDFLYVADSKLLSKETMAFIHDHGGFFLAPAPMYASYQAVFDQAFETHSSERLLLYQDHFNRGFDVPCPVTVTGHTYPFRMIILYDTGLFARKPQALEALMEKTKAAFALLDTKLNTSALKTADAIDQACAAMLMRYQTAAFFDDTRTNTPRITSRQAKRGRPAAGPPPEKRAVITDQFQVARQFHDAVFEQALVRCGYDPLLTNHPPDALSIAEAMRHHKDQYKSEHTYRRAKSDYQLEPIYLHLPERIAAFLFLLKIALQILVLLERTARQNLTKRQTGLNNFRPNRQDVRNPRAEALLKEFQYLVTGEMVFPDGRRRGVISDLTDLQKDILVLLEVPLIWFTYDYLSNPGGEEVIRLAKYLSYDFQRAKSKSYSIIFNYH